MGERTDSFGDSPVAIGMIECDLPISKQKRSKSHFNLKVQTGVMTKENRLLGSFGERAFELSDGRTAFAGLRAEWQKDQNLSVFGAFYRGITQAKGGVLFANEVRTDSESWTLGIRHRHLFSPKDSWEFSIHQPSRAVVGEAKLLLLSDRRGESQDNSLSLSARGRELDIGISYRRALSELSEMGLGLLYRRHPGHLSTASADRLAVFSFKMKW